MLRFVDEDAVGFGAATIKAQHLAHRETIREERIK
jgi:hypothetical protein